MLDYLFFDDTIAQAFAQHAQTLPTQVVTTTTPEGGIQISVTEETLDDSQRQQLETWYDQFFFGDQAEAIQQEDAGTEACGVQIQLSSGEFTTVLLDPKLMSKLLTALEVEEIQTLFSQIASAVENPQSMSVCHAMQCAMIDLAPND